MICVDEELLWARLVSDPAHFLDKVEWILNFQIFYYVLPLRVVTHTVLGFSTVVPRVVSEELNL